MVEGLKAITEFFNSAYTLHSIYAIKDMTAKLPNLSHKQKVFEVSINELEKISALQNPQGVLAVVEMPIEEDMADKDLNDITLVLDGVQDPGNMGTIIRTADWFGFKDIICSKDTVDIYNPKVVQATMGSLARMNIWYTDLEEILHKSDTPIFGALLNGENIFKVDWPEKGFLIFGSEGNGISPKILPYLTHPVTIPGYGQTESLNVAVSAAICCAEMRRNILK